MAFCATLFLTACANSPARVETITAEKPVPVACVKSVPSEEPAPIIASDADIEQLAAWARLREKQHRLYIGKLRALLLACLAQPT